MASNRRLKQARELRGWSQAKVAEQIGTDATTVSRWERGLFSPTPYFRERLCTLFNKNAEELGLLESSHLLHEEEHRDLSDRASIAFSSLHTSEGRQKEEPHARAITPPVAPSWPKRTDTFTYILHSAAHDQQAHMLWEDAYVRALHGQRAEAQYLGEASLSAFERVGHFNAVAIREWLEQRDLVSSPDSPPTPLPAQQEPRKLSIKQALRRRSRGIALALILISTLFLAAFSFEQIYPTVSASPLVAHASSTAKATGGAQEGLPNGPRGSTMVLSTPTMSVTPVSSSSSSLTAEAEPGNLTPQACHLESLGYRCDVTLWFYTSVQGTFSWNWRIGQTTLPVHFSSFSGTGQSGQPCQLTLYIRSAPGQQGQLTFIFTSSAGNTTALLRWQG